MNNFDWELVSIDKDKKAVVLRYGELKIICAIRENEERERPYVLFPQGVFLRSRKEFQEIILFVANAWQGLLSGV